LDIFEVARLVHEAEAREIELEDIRIGDTVMCVTDKMVRYGVVHHKTYTCAKTVEDFAVAVASVGVKNYLLNRPVMVLPTEPGSLIRVISSYTQNERGSSFRVGHILEHTQGNTWIGFSDGELYDEDYVAAELIEWEQVYLSPLGNVKALLKKSLVSGFGYSELENALREDGVL